MIDAYYVYCFLDPTKPGKYYYDGMDFCFLYEPFYIGKGKGNRINRHLHRDVINKEPNKLKKNKILKIIKEGEEVMKIKILQNVSEYIALKLEKEIIVKIGRRDLKEGTLCNLSNGGERGEKQNQENRKKSIVQYDVNGCKVKSFHSIKQASEELNISKGCISLCCNRKIYTYKNYIWRFEYDNDIEYNIGLSKGYKKVIRYFNDGTNKIYNSIKEASKDLGISSSNLVNYLKGDVPNKNIDMRYYDNGYDNKYKSIRDSKLINAKCKPIIQKSLDNEFIRYWNSASDVEKELKWSASTISACCRGGRKTAYKYKWSYKNK